MTLALLLAAALAAPLAAAPADPAGSTPATGAPAAAAPAPSPGAAVRPFNPDRPGQMNAEEFRLNFRTRKVVVVGKPLVTLQHDDATLTCKRLSGDQDAAGKLKVAVCEGEVRLVRAGRVVTCDRATYDRPAGTVVCTGHPLLKDLGGSEARATTMTYDLGNDEIRLEGDAQVLVPGSEIDAGLPSLKGNGGAPPAPAPAKDAKPAPTPAPTPAAARPGGAP